MKARIVHLHKTAAEWEALGKQQTIIPKPGEFFIYDPDSDHKYARLKIGDGNTSLKDLPFAIDAAVQEFILTQMPPNIIDGGRIC